MTKDLKDYYSDAERQTIEEYEKKMKAVRDKAVKRRQADIRFWKQIDNRLDEVYEYVMRKRAERSAEQNPASGMGNADAVSDEKVQNHYGSGSFIQC